MKFLELFDVSVEIENKTTNFVNLFVTLREIINNEPLRTLKTYIEILDDIVLNRKMSSSWYND